MTFARRLAIAASSFAALTAAVPAFAASHAEPLGRAADGRPVVLHADAREVVVFWSPADTAALDEARALDAAGYAVIVVAEQAAGAKSELVPALRAHSFDVPLLVDPTGDVRRRLHVAPGVPFAQIGPDLRVTSPSFATLEAGHPGAMASLR